MHGSCGAIGCRAAVVVPINHRWVPAEVGFALNDSGASVLVVDESFLPAVAQIREHADVSNVVVMSDGDGSAGTISFEQLIAANQPMADGCRGDGELFGIFYTGGTTGQAKGVMLTHANVIASALGSLATGQFVTPGGRLLHAAPMFHLADLATSGRLQRQRRAEPDPVA
jgi:acyl-CoA synthetase (AMP-forming)/AMP-acid ligase II